MEFQHCFFFSTWLLEPTATQTQTSHLFAGHGFICSLGGGTGPLQLTNILGLHAEALFMLKAFHAATSMSVSMQRHFSCWGLFMLRCQARLFVLDAACFSPPEKLLFLLDSCAPRTSFLTNKNLEATPLQTNNTRTHKFLVLFVTSCAPGF